MAGSDREKSGRQARSGIPPWRALAALAALVFATQAAASRQSVSDPVPPREASPPAAEPGAGTSSEQGENEAARTEEARALEAAVARAQTLGAELARLRSARVEMREEFAVRRMRLEGDLRGIEGELEESRRARADLEERIVAHRSARDASVRVLEAVVRDARAFADRWIDRASRGVPSVRADQPRLELLRARLAAEEPEPRFSAARDLMTEATDAIARWRRRSLVSARATPPGTDLAVHAWVLRLGTVGEWFVGETGQHMGAAARVDGADWSGVSDPEACAALVEAADRLRGHRRPAFDLLPMFAPVRAGGAPPPSGGSAAPSTGREAGGRAPDEVEPERSESAAPSVVADGSASPSPASEGVPGDVSEGSAAVPAEGRDAVSLEEEAEALERAVEKERTGLATERLAGEQALERLAGRLIAMELERLELAEALGAARRAEAEARVEAERVAASKDAVVAATRTLAGALEVHARETPGCGQLAERAAGIARLFEGERGAAAQREALELFEALDRRAGSVCLDRRTLRTASGALETVDLLSIGHVAFAYLAGDRVGVAVAAPRAAAGYRWREDLPTWIGDAWRRAFERVREDVGRSSGSSATRDRVAPLPISPPVDATGELSADASLGAATPLEQFERGGPVMWPLAAVALLCALLLSERAIELYGQNRLGSDLGRRVVAALAARDTDAALALAERSRGAVGRTVAAVIEEQSRPIPEMESRIQETILLELPRLQRSLRGIAVLAAVAPLLGLLGTVTGIIETFGVLGSVGQSDPGLMAGGISQALLTTASGLMIAIPVLLLHGVLSGRVDTIVATAEGQSVLVANAIESELGGGRRA